MAKFFIFYLSVLGKKLHVIAVFNSHLRK